MGTDYLALIANQKKVQTAITARSLGPFRSFEPYGCTFSPRFSIPMNFSIRLARVSGFLAS